MALAFVSGQLLTASALNALVPAQLVKASSQTNLTTTLANDAELALTLQAGYTYRIELRLYATGAQAGDIKLAWTKTGTITHVGGRTCRGPSVATTDSGASVAAAVTVGVLRSSGGHALTTSVSYGTDGTLNSAIEEEFVLTCTATGVIQLQWAQNSGPSGTTTVSSGSYIIATPIL